MVTRVGQLSREIQEREAQLQKEREELKRKEAERSALEARLRERKLQIQQAQRRQTGQATLGRISRAEMLSSEEGQRLRQVQAEEEQQRAEVESIEQERAQAIAEQRALIEQRQAREREAEQIERAEDIVPPRAEEPLETVSLSRPAFQDSIKQQRERLENRVQELKSRGLSEQRAREVANEEARTGLNLEPRVVMIERLEERPSTLERLFPIETRAFEALPKEREFKEVVGKIAESETGAKFLGTTGEVQIIETERPLTPIEELQFRQERISPDVSLTRQELEEAFVRERLEKGEVDIQEQIEEPRVIERREELVRTGFFDREEFSLLGAAELVIKGEKKLEKALLGEPVPQETQLGKAIQAGISIAPIAFTPIARGISIGASLVETGVLIGTTKLTTRDVLASFKEPEALGELGAFALGGRAVPSRNIRISKFGIEDIPKAKEFRRRTEEISESLKTPEGRRGLLLRGMEAFKKSVEPKKVGRPKELVTELEFKFLTPEETASQLFERRARKRGEITTSELERLTKEVERQEDIQAGKQRQLEQELSRRAEFQFERLQRRKGLETGAERELRVERERKVEGEFERFLTEQQRFRQREVREKALVEERIFGETARRLEERKLKPVKEERFRNLELIRELQEGRRTEQRIKSDLPRITERLKEQGLIQETRQGQLQLLKPLKVERKVETAENIQELFGSFGRLEQPRIRIRVRRRQRLKPQLDIETELRIRERRIARQRAISREKSFQESKQLERPKVRRGLLSIPSVRQQQETLTTQFQRRIPTQKQRLRIETRQRQRQDLRIGERQELGFGQAELEIQVQKLEQRQAQRQVFRTPQLLRQRFRQREKPTKPKRPREEAGYQAQVRRKGKFITLNETPLTKKQAERLARTVTDKTSVRSYRIKKTDRPADKELRVLGRTQSKKFRPSKSNKNILVEKSKFAIDTRGEKTQITEQGLKALARKSLFKKVKNVLRL